MRRIKYKINFFEFVRVVIIGKRSPERWWPKEKRKEKPHENRTKERS